MSATEAPDTVAAPEPPQQARHYGFSVLLSGFARMWRAWLPALIVIVANAAAQAAFVMTNPQVSWEPTFILLLVGSILVFLVTGAVLTAGAYESVTQRVPVGLAFSRANRHFWLYSLWVILQGVVVLIGTAFNSWPGILLAWLTVFIPLAAIDGQRNALGANFRAIWSHPFRWIVTGLIIAVFLLVGFLLNALNSFFIGGVVGSFVAMLVSGLFAWWWLTAWACLYRSRRGADQPEQE